MPVSTLKVPVEVRNFIRHLHPELKRKFRAALADILEDASCGNALKEELEGYWSLRVGRSRIIYRLLGRTWKSLPLVRVKLSMNWRLDNFSEVGRSPDIRMDG